MVRVSCSIPRGIGDLELQESLRALGIKPIVTPYIVRAVYEGTDEDLGRKIVSLFDAHKGSEITADFGKKKHKH